MTRSASASDIQKNFGKWNDIAQREPVQVVKHGRESSYLISADAYRELLSSYRRRTLVRDLDDTEIRLLSEAQIAEEDRYDLPDDGASRSNQG
jgi:PHD/YefM family antitoxin component YafN of YafNO toxin-antitoxin module